MQKGGDNFATGCGRADDGRLAWRESDALLHHSGCGDHYGGAPARHFMAEKEVGSMRRSVNLPESRRHEGRSTRLL